MRIGTACGQDGFFVDFCRKQPTIDNACTRAGPAGGHFSLGVEMKSILVVSGVPEIFARVRSFFPQGYRVDHAADQENALGLLREVPYGVLILDLDRLYDPLPGNGFKGVFQPFWHVRPAVEVIVVMPKHRSREGKAALRAGASCCLSVPLDPRELKQAVEGGFRSLLVPSDKEDPLDRFWQADSLEVVRTKSPRMQEVFDRLRSVAPTRSTVLLLGETGTGKGVLARLIHRHSSRRQERFVNIHCGAIPETLVESELFGHEKGAFTGAVRRKAGTFELARGGTVFLDEAGTITPAAQVKLLQVLQEGVFRRVGGEEIIQTDIRVVAATNADLEAMCKAGLFRKDLYYRLNVFPVEIPPLRERREDIPSFVEAFLRKLNRLNGREIHGVDPSVIEGLMVYPWPGNIRELENLIERAYILETSSVLSTNAFPAELLGKAPARPDWRPASTEPLAEARRRFVEEAEQTYLRELLSRHKGRIQASAAAAGVSTRQLHKLMRKYGIRKEAFR